MLRTGVHRLPADFEAWTPALIEASAIISREFARWRLRFAGQCRGRGDDGSGGLLPSA